MAPVVVQAAQNGIGNGTSLTVTLGKGTETGNCLVVGIETSATGTNGTISGVTLGGLADHWGSLLTQGTGASGSIVAFWADPNCSGGLTSVVVSTTGSSGAQSIMATVWEVSGLPSTLAALLDQSGSTEHDPSSATFTISTGGSTVLASEIAFGSVGGTASTPTLPDPLHHGCSARSRPRRKPPRSRAITS